LVIRVRWHLPVAQHKLAALAGNPHMTVSLLVVPASIRFKAITQKKVVQVWLET
jgi:hypothetical protein